ncbi:Stress responsive alpha-beta barrel domain protein [Methanococcus maripaludis C5]|uniref:Stress responsive alpha-beta barrel domain protein n=1 Tax=Methanococcus maripaludis (strain C5 / ATCC BAA-1333) TaxID=402880 RepID=A4FXS2_METM5|nr:Dabb family protein [Methanococcus maripaludis]ABO35006.1 Stress responsive alpha-beta barrel domain protein [Methanococcus maripaludis C5]
MIKHIVMWKLKDNANANEKLENAKIIKTNLEALKEVIPEIKYIEVGIDSKKFENNYDVVLVSEFGNFEDLDVYQKHPSHLKVGKFVKSVAELRTAVDYEF